MRPASARMIGAKRGGMSRGCQRAVGQDTEDSSGNGLSGHGKDAGPISGQAAGRFEGEPGGLHGGGKGRAGASDGEGAPPRGRSFYAHLARPVAGQPGAGAGFRSCPSCFRSGRCSLLQRAEAAGMLGRQDDAALDARLLRTPGSTAAGIDDELPRVEWAMIARFGEK